MRLLSAWALCFVSVIFVCSTEVRANEIVNGEFTAGLGSWTASGNASANNNEALFSDSPACGAPCATLFQVVTLAAGDYSLSFDFMDNLSVSVPDGTFPDTFFASLYETSTPGSFNPNDQMSFSSAAGLMDLDRNGVSNLALNAVVGSSLLKGAGWSHYFLNFTLASTQSLAIVFDFFAQNTLTGDSTIRIDNVIISAPTAAVPEPGTLLLLSFGLGGLASARRRQVRT